ncbi:hypothetical protein TNCV_4845231 [Trichonephila clavipes]|uniref:Uncharacterized protein n=1 Tax=Trichonephila clavipes TaxID=2585209 RepID=A0A8X7BLA0_TRICX|nr:hypothetical protein TNCV_4845231 [Trichonephila clavipes]
MEELLSIREGITPSANKKRITVIVSSLVQFDNGAAMLYGLLHSNNYEEWRVTRCMLTTARYYAVAKP